MTYYENRAQEGQGGSRCGHEHPTKRAAMQCKRRHMAKFKAISPARAYRRSRWAHDFEVTRVNTRDDGTPIPGWRIVSGRLAGKEIAE